MPIEKIAHEFSFERDPDDEPVVNLAIAARAQFLVSRDSDLLELAGADGFRRADPGLAIVEPVDMLRILRGEVGARVEQ